MTLTPKQQAIVELGLDHLDAIGDADYSKVTYAIDQLVEGGSPEYHGGERPDRSDSDKTMFISIITTALLRKGLINHQEAS